MSVIKLQSCPNCGSPDIHDDSCCEDWDWICRDCGEKFEVPDVEYEVTCPMCGNINNDILDYEDNGGLLLQCNNPHCYHTWRSFKYED